MRREQQNRNAFTLLELLVVIAIILALAALAAAFLPRVSDSQRLSRAVDSLEQWLLTAKMRAKRDGLATGLRFVQAEGDAPGNVSQFQYIQQPGPLIGGYLIVPPPPPDSPPPGAIVAPSPPFPPGQLLIGGYLASGAGGVVTFGNVDFSLGGLPAQQWLVQPGDYLEVNGGGVYAIASVASATTIQLSASAYAQALSISAPVTNYRILRQQRLLIGEAPLNLPRNYAAQFHQLPGSSSALSGCNVAQGTNGYWEILFSPTGQVIGANGGKGTLYVSLWDTTMTVPDINSVGIVGIRCNTGFIGAYSASPGDDPFYFVKTARESGM